MKSIFSRLYALFLAGAAIVASSSQINAMNPTNQDQDSLFTRVNGSFGKLFHGQFDQMDADDYSRIITTTAVTAGVCYGIYWCFFKEHKEPGKPVNLGRAIKNYGQHNKALSNNVRLRQLQVAGQRGSTCGYHALKNGILVVNALHGYNADTLQRNLLDTRLANRLTDQWRGYVDARRRATNERARGESLFGEEINDLFRIEQNFYPLINPGRGYFDYARTLEAPCGLSTLAEAHLNQRSLDNIRREFNRTRGPRSHIFILNSGNHWYTVVLHKAANGKREYIAMDTGRLNLRRSGIRDLITHIEGAHVARTI